MLHGKLKFNDLHLGVVDYTVYARDSFDDTKLYIINDSTEYSKYENGVYVWDKQVNPETGQHYNNYPDGMVSCKTKDGSMMDLPVGDKRRLDVKKTNKYKTNITNRDFCLKVSALIRYMQITGKKNYNQEGDVQFSNTRVVNVDNLGTVTFNMGLITDIVCANQFVALELHTVPDDVFDIAVFKDLKVKDKYDNILSTTPVEIVGFKLHQDILGFEYIPPAKKEFANVLGMFDNIEDVIANNPDKNTEWILERKYEIVTDENLDQIMAEFMAYDGLIAFDTETTGLSINFKSRTGEADQLTGCVLSKQKGTGYYFPLQHKLFANLCDGDHWYFMEKYMRPILEGKRIICHNTKFDWKVAYIYEINTNVVYDTMLAFGVTKRYEEESYELGLKSLVRNIFGLDMFDLSDFVTGSSFSDSGITFADLPYEIVRRYAPADADMTLSLYEFLEKEDIINKYNAKTVFELEIDFSKAVGYSEFFGYHIEVEKIPELQEKILNAMEQYKQEMFAMAGREFNPNSPQQLVKIMYDELGIEQIGPKRSTDKDTLKALAAYVNEKGEPKHPFVVALKSYRDNEGIFKNFLKRLHEFCTSDGYIFPDVMTLGTNTGRVSIKNPNYQSYNDTVKHYVTPRPDYIQSDSDFAQIEYRVLASMARQMELVHQFDDPDLDYHTHQASRMFSIPYALVSKTLRQQSKGVNFGLPYGMGDPSLGARIFGERNDANTAKAANLRRKFFQGQEKIQQFFDVARSSGVANGFTSTDFGRRRYYHRGVFSVNEIKRQAGNHVIQGTAADIYKFAVVRLFRRVCKENWLGLVLFNAFVHDELVTEIHKSINPYYYTKVWREEFEVPIENYCKLYAGLGFGFCWYDAKKLDLPPQYIQEIIDKYQEDMPWHEDHRKFIQEVKDGFKDYCIRRVRVHITAPENQGDIIKPIIGTLLSDTVKDIIKDTKDNPVEVARLNALISEPKIKGDGTHKIKSLQDLLKVYCDKYGISYESIDIKAPEDALIQATPEGNQEEEVSLEFQDMNKDEFAHSFVQFSGTYADVETDTIYVANIVAKNGVNIIDFCNRQGYFTNEGEYSVRMFLNPDDIKSLIITNAKLTRENYSLVKSAYKTLLTGGAF